MGGFFERFLGCFLRRFNGKDFWELLEGSFTKNFYNFKSGFDFENFRDFLKECLFGLHSS